MIVYDSGGISYDVFKNNMKHFYDIVMNDDMVVNIFSSSENANKYIPKEIQEFLTLSLVNTMKRLRVDSGRLSALIGLVNYYIEKNILMSDSIADMKNKLSVLENFSKYIYKDVIIPKIVVNKEGRIYMTPFFNMDIPTIVNILRFIKTVDCDFTYIDVNAAEPRIFFYNDESPITDYYTSICNTYGFNDKSFIKKAIISTIHGGNFTTNNDDFNKTVLDKIKESVDDVNVISFVQSKFIGKLGYFLNENDSVFMVNYDGALIVKW